MTSDSSTIRSTRKAPTHPTSKGIGDRCLRDAIEVQVIGQARIAFSWSPPLMTIVDQFLNVPGKPDCGTFAYECPWCQATSDKI